MDEAKILGKSSLIKVMNDVIILSTRITITL